MKTLEKPQAKETLFQPVMIPTAKRRVLGSTLSLRVNDKLMDFINSELSKMGVKSKQERADFLRGAIVAGIVNARRAESPAWAKFIKAVQGPAKKYLGSKLALDGPEDMIEAGELF